jgi:deoxyribose-phosphate aldolase
MSLPDDLPTFAGRLHFGVQGIAATTQETEATIARLLATGLRVRAFDTELTYVPLVKSLLPVGYPVHVPVAYPMGNVPTAKKMLDLDKAVELGVRDSCVALDYRALLSGRWSKVEDEVRQVAGRFSAAHDYLAFILPATLMSAPDIVAACSAIGEGGGKVIKLNPGAGLGVTREEVMLIHRRFGRDRFDVHPSGGIRSLDEVLAYRELGCTTIHTRSALRMIEEYGARLAARRAT